MWSGNPQQSFCRATAVQQSVVDGLVHLLVICEEGLERALRCLGGGEQELNRKTWLPAPPQLYSPPSPCKERTTPSQSADGAPTAAALVQTAPAGAPGPLHVVGAQGARLERPPSPQQETGLPVARPRLPGGCRLRGSPGSRADAWEPLNRTESSRLANEERTSAVPGRWGHRVREPRAGLGGKSG